MHVCALTSPPRLVFSCNLRLLSHKRGIYTHYSGEKCWGKKNQRTCDSQQWEDVMYCWGHISENLLGGRELGWCLKVGVSGSVNTVKR